MTPKSGWQRSVGWRPLVWALALLCCVAASRADVATPFPDYDQLRRAAGVVHEPTWSEVKARPEAWRGVTVGYFLKLDGRIDSDGLDRLYTKNRAGDTVDLWCVGGCRVGQPGDWLGVLGTVSESEPRVLLASAVTRIAPPEAAGPQAGAELPATTEGSAVPLPGIPSSAPIAPEPAGPPPAELPADPPALQPSGPGHFAPPYEMVDPRHLEVLERFIVSCNKRLRPDLRRFIAAEIIRVSAEHQVRWEFYAGIVAAESDFDPTCTSSKGAAGLAQLMPVTALEVGVPVNQRYDIRQNLNGALTYIRKQLNNFLDRDPATQLTLTLASYNAGPGAVRRYGGVPPYRETINYINRVTRHYLDLAAQTASLR